MSRIPDQQFEAIRTVLAAYRSTEATITREQITAAWDEYESVRGLDAERESVADRADRLVADIRLSMKTLQQQHAAAWQEVDRLHQQLRGAGNALRELIEDAERAYNTSDVQEIDLGTARAALAQIGGLS